MELLVGANGLFGKMYRNVHPNSDSIISIDRTNASLLFGESNNDTIDLFALEVLLKKLRPNRVIYAAQYSDYRSFDEQDIRKMNRVNVLQPVALAEVLSRLGIPGTFFSSGSVYAPKPAPLLETDPLKVPYESEPYVASKITFENILHANQLLAGMILLRPFVMFGVGQRPSSLIPKLIRNISSGISVYLNGESGLIVNPIPIQLAVAAVNELHFRRLEGVFNLAGNNSYSIAEIATRIATLLNKDVHFEHHSVEGEAVLLGDICKLQSATGLELLNDIDSFLTDMIST